MSREYIIEPPFHDRVRRVLGSKGITNVTDEDPVRVSLDDMEYRSLARKVRDRHVTASIKPSDGKPAPEIKSAEVAEKETLRSTVLVTTPEPEKSKKDGD